MSSSAGDNYNNIHSKPYEEFCRRFKEIEQNIQLTFPFSFDAEGAPDSI
jgi:hypothetical protein